MFMCPGCKEMHQVQIGDGAGPRWGFNGDYDRPTFTPSIKVTGKRRLTEDEYQRVMAGEKIDVPDMCCHSFVMDGQIQFLGDCTHELANQTVSLEVPA